MRGFAADVRRGGASSGAGATRTSSPRPRRSSRSRAALASTSASSRPRSSARRALEDVELPPPRLEPPAALGRDLQQRPLRARHPRLRQGLPRPRARAARPLRPPARRGRAPARRGARSSSVLDWCADAGAAAIPYGGGTSVVGGVEPRVPQDAGGHDRPAAGSTGCSRSTPVSRAARIQAGATGPGAGGAAASAHGLTLRHYPQSFEYSTLGGWIATRAGGHFATLHTHIDDFVESVRALTPSGVWESRRLPGSGAGPEPGPDADRLRGHPRRDHRGLGARAGGARASRSRPAVLFDGFEQGAEAVRALAQSRLYPSNCRLLDPGEAALTGAAPDGQGAAGARLRGGDDPVDAWMARALELCARPRRRAQRERARRVARAPGATRSCARPTCATR